MQGYSHLVTFNENGLWIKENLNNKDNCTTTKPEGLNLIDVTIFTLIKITCLMKKFCKKSRY